MDIYSLTDTIPLSFARVRNSALVPALAPTVSVVNAKTASSLLASTAMVEASGIYVYSWTHGLVADTICLVTYAVAGSKYSEFILISNDSSGSRAAF